MGYGPLGIQKVIGKPFWKWDKTPKGLYPPKSPKPKIFRLGGKTGFGHLNGKPEAGFTETLGSKKRQKPFFSPPGKIWVLRGKKGALQTLYAPP